MLHQKPERIKLPLTVTFLISRRGDSVVAHSLDFDLVAVEATQAEASAKLRQMVRIYIEHGLRNRWEDDIMFSAPPEYWAKLTVDTPISLEEPIHIDGRSLVVYSASDQNMPKYKARRLARG